MPHPSGTLEGFKNVKGSEILVFYPEKGVSTMQKLQMVTQEGENVAVVGVKGNFDDAQTAVKEIFTDEAVKAKLKEKGKENSADETVYCYFKGWKDESGTLIIDFWYDSHIDHLIPLVALATKK